MIQYPSPARDLYVFGETQNNYRERIGFNNYILKCYIVCVSSTILIFFKQQMNSCDSEKTQNTTGIHSGPGYRVWTNTELSECFTKLVLCLFSCAVDGLQTFFLNFPLKTQLFLKTKHFFQN